MSKYNLNSNADSFLRKSSIRTKLSPFMTRVTADRKHGDKIVHLPRAWHFLLLGYWTWYCLWIISWDSEDDLIEHWLSTLLLSRWRHQKSERKNNISKANSLAKIKKNSFCMGPATLVVKYQNSCMFLVNSYFLTLLSVLSTNPISDHQGHSRLSMHPEFMA